MLKTKLAQKKKIHDKAVIYFHAIEKKIQINK